MKKYLIFPILFACCVLTTNAQKMSELQIGLAVPLGNFADNNVDNAIYDGSGVAAPGFYLGYKLLLPLTTFGLYGTFNAGIMYNDLQSSYKDKKKDRYGDYYDIILPKYLNVPVLAGLQYEKSISDGFKLNAVAGVGLNVLIITKYSLYNEDIWETSERTDTFKPSFKLCYKFGVGFVLQDKYTLSLHYIGLGSHIVKYEYLEVHHGGMYNRWDKNFDEALSISSFNITFGIRLFSRK